MRPCNRNGPVLLVGRRHRPRCRQPRGARPYFRSALLAVGFIRLFHMRSTCLECASAGKDSQVRTGTPVLLLGRHFLRRVQYPQPQLLVTQVGMREALNLLNALDRFALRVKPHQRSIAPAVPSIMRARSASRYSGSSTRRSAASRASRVTLLRVPGARPRGLPDWPGLKRCAAGVLRACYLQKSPWR